MIPNLTKDQRLINLDRAMDARRRRAAVLSRVRTGDMTVPEVLELAESDERISRMSALTLLKAVPGYGLKRSQAVLAKLHIAESRRLRGLGEKQRAALIEHFGGVR